MKRVTYSIGCADDDGICVSQTPAAGGVQSLILNGALTRISPEMGFRDWLADAPRLVTITSGGNDTGITFTITGVVNGKADSETLAGASGAAKAFVKVWDSISGITCSGNTASTVKVGTTNAVKIPWIPMNLALTPFSVDMIVNTSTSPTVIYTAESTLDDIFDPAVTPIATPCPAMTGMMVASKASYAEPVTAIRLNMTSFTVGTVTFNVCQAGSDRY